MQQKAGQEQQGFALNQEPVILCTMIFDDEIRYCVGDMWVAVKRDRRAPQYQDFRSRRWVTIATA